MRDKAVLKVFTIDTIMHQMFAKKKKSLVGALINPL